MNGMDSGQGKNSRSRQRIRSVVIVCAGPKSVLVIVCTDGCRKKAHTDSGETNGVIRAAEIIVLVIVCTDSGQEQVHAAGSDDRHQVKPVWDLYVLG